MLHIKEKCLTSLLFLLLLFLSCRVHLSTAATSSSSSSSGSFLLGCCTYTTAVTSVRKLLTNWYSSACHNDADQIFCSSQCQIWKRHSEIKQSCKSQSYRGTNKMINKQKCKKKYEILTSSKLLRKKIDLPRVSLANTSGKFFSSHCLHLASSGMYSQY